MQRNDVGDYEDKTWHKMNLSFTSKFRNCLDWSQNMLRLHIWVGIVGGGGGGCSFLILSELLHILSSFHATKNCLFISSKCKVMIFVLILLKTSLSAFLLAWLASKQIFFKSGTSARTMTVISLMY